MEALARLGGRGRWSRLWATAVLVAVLAVTTGWAQSSELLAAPQRPSAGHVADDIAISNPRTVPAPAVAVADRQVSRPRRPEASGESATGATSSTPSVNASAKTFSGRDHFWIPSLGISQSVSIYRCGRTSPLANRIYRWGCGGVNNVYILGHAWGVLKPLHDAYVSGRLHVGMLAIYADGNGNIRSYEVTAWQVVRPTEVAWATASQPVPSMTVQTCIGATSAWRLDVRFVAVD